MNRGANGGILGPSMRSSSEAELRYPLERSAFVVFAVLNFPILALAVWMVTRGAVWLSHHPFFSNHTDKIKTAAIAGIAATEILRNTRRAVVPEDRFAPSRRGFRYSQWKCHPVALRVHRLCESGLIDLERFKKERQHG